VREGQKPFDAYRGLTVRVGRIIETQRDEPLLRQAHHEIRRRRGEAGSDRV